MNEEERLTTMQLNERFQQESIEFQSRLLEGIRTLGKLDAITVGTTPKSSIYKENELNLYRYNPLVESTSLSEPLLIVYALVNRPYIVDLYEERSLVQGLLKQGVDVYLIDWGYPGPGDSHQDLPDYVSGMIHQCVEQTLSHSGASKVNILGICQGGTMSLCYTALNPDKVRSLVTMVTPVDFHTPDNVLANWFREIDVDRLVDTMGNVSGMALNSIFLSLKPFRLGIEKYLDFVQIMDQRDKVENFLRMEKWIFDSPDQAGEMFRTFIKEFFHNNRFVNNSLKIDGEEVDLKNITQPILNLMAKQDHLVPPSSSIALKYLTSSNEYSEHIYDTGHIGIYVSSRAGKDIPIRISDWLTKHCE